MIEGTIVGIEDHGTIVSLVIAETPEQLANHVGSYLHLDHRPFSWIVDAETSGDPIELIGRPVRGNSQSIRFLDQESI